MILVTGGAGYIGAHFVWLLQAAGQPCVVLDDVSRGRADFVPERILIRGDVGDAVLVERICREYGVTEVVHFAAFAYVGESTSDPARYWGNNVVMTWHMFEALRKASVRRIVFSSSCATYGIPATAEPILEGMAQLPINPYGNTKLTIERMLRDYRAAYGLQYAILRYFNAAGASERYPLFEPHDPETHLIPLAIDAACGGKPLVVFGTQHDTADGTCVRDYIHVDDLGSAHVAALEALRNGAGALELNLGLGWGYSVREVIRTVAGVVGSAVGVQEGDPRPGDPPALVANPNLAHQRLGWQPRYQDLDAVVRTAYTGHARKIAQRFR